MSTTSKANQQEQLLCDMHNSIAYAASIAGWLRDPEITPANREMYLDSLDEHLKTVFRLNKRIQKLSAVEVEA